MVPPVIENCTCYVYSLNIFHFLHFIGINYTAYWDNKPFAQAFRPPDPTAIPWRRADGSGKQVHCPLVTIFFIFSIISQSCHELRNHHLAKRNAGVLPSNNFGKF